jgi:hypothetical protein
MNFRVRITHLLFQASELTIDLKNSQDLARGAILDRSLSSENLACHPNYRMPRASPVDRLGGGIERGRDF